MRWGPKSLACIETLEPDLQRVLERVKDRMTERDLDCSVACGYRDSYHQGLAVAAGRSFASFPHSAHNHKPSPAMDVIPYPVDWLAIDEFYRLAAVILNEAHALDVRLKWGGLFKRSQGRLFFDGPHYQLVKER